LFIAATDYLQLEEATSSKAMVLLLTQLAAANYELLLGKFQLNPKNGEITLSVELNLDDGLGSARSTRSCTTSRRPRTSGTRRSCAPRRVRESSDRAGDRRRALVPLERAQRDGSWGYQRGAAGQLEPTILCAATGLEIAGDWIRAQPRAWPSLLLPAAIADRDPSLASETADWILTQQSVSVDLCRRSSTGPSRVVVGRGNAAWVEPTCYAILSLVRTGKGAQRIADGRRLLRDRQCRTAAGTTATRG
jgi:hypothetical protein